MNNTLVIHRLCKLPIKLDISHRLSGLVVLLLCVACFWGCSNSTRNNSDAIIEKMRAKAANSTNEALRQGVRNLMMTSQVNKNDMVDETRVLFNAWLTSADPRSIEFKPSKLLENVDPSLLSKLGCDLPETKQLAAADIECLYEVKLMHAMSEWIVAAPVRDKVFQPILSAKMSSMTPEGRVKLEQAYKLFDWTIRNIKLAPHESSQTSVKIRDPRPPLIEGGVGYNYMPWEAAVFSQADFIVRGRVFNALANQQGIDTCWISVGSAPGAAGDLFAIGVLVDNQLLLFEPKLGVPILDPDTDAFATVQDVAKNEKILRRLNLPQYEYAFQQPAIVSVQLLIDASPFSLSKRAKLLESGLTGNDRMVLSRDADALAERLNNAVPNSTVSLWLTPIFAQLYATNLQESLKDYSQKSILYMQEHLIWLIDYPLAHGRDLHLNGKFENTPERIGALKTYVETRVDDESLKKMGYNPDVQRTLGIERDPNESQQMFDARVAQAIMMFNRAKFDVAFLLGQLHFDRGDYKSSAYWLSERLLPGKRAVRWESAGWYTLARAYIELGDYDAAEEALTKPAIEDGKQPFAVNPQDAGNRIRLRYLKRLVTAKEGSKAEATP